MSNKFDDLDHFRSRWIEELQVSKEPGKQEANLTLSSDTIRDPLPSAEPKNIDNSFAVSTQTADDPLSNIIMNMSKMSIEEKHTQSLILYEKGLQLENDERLQDSIKYYRIAHKLDNTVDKRYREKYNKQIKATLIEKQELSAKFEQKSNVLKVVQEAYIFKLPSELLVKIMKYFVPYELEVLFNLSLTCSTFSNLFEHLSIWSKAYKCICPDVTNDVDYRLLFHTTPHLRFDGMYISVCRYIRAGLAIDCLNAPVHVVQYYRYIRFYQDHSCLVRLSNDHPSKLVSALSQPNLERNGSWALDDDILSISIRDNEIFTMKLHLKRIKKRFNRLEWIDYVCHTGIEDYQIPLRNERAFKFSKVNSIVRQLY